MSRVGDREDTLISPDLQAERIANYASSRGIEVEMLGAELDVSGGKIDRPVLEEAIMGVESGRFAGIVVADIDRLSRLNLVDALKVIERVEKGAGGQVIAVAQNFDAGTPEGRWGRNMWLATAHMQLERYGLQFRAAKQSAVQRGVWMTNTPPLGYTVTRRKEGGDGRLKIDPANRDRVLRGFEARAAGKPWREVAQVMGVGMSNAAKIIRNRVYLGELRLTARGDDGAVVEKWVNPDAHELLVPRDLWEAAQLHHPRPARRGNGPALLGGLIRCATCGCVMSRSSSKKGVIYRCVAHNTRGPSCPAPAIMGERKANTYVEALALAELKRLTVSARERTDEIDRAMERLHAAEAELEAYQRAVSVTELGAESFGAGMRSRAAAVEDVRREVASARLAAGPAPAPGTLLDLWPEMSVAERRHVLRGALSGVFVRKGRGPCEERVRVIAAGFDLPPGPLPDTDIPGEIRTSVAQDVE